MKMDPWSRARRDCLAGLGLLSLAGWARAEGAPPQRPTRGRVHRLESFASRHVDARNVEVWLPDGYDEKARAGSRYAVVYMHDGQMLFDASNTWNHKTWRIDVAASRLMDPARVRDFIIVGPWNNGEYRHSEYFPAGALPHLAPGPRRAFEEKFLHGRARSDEYLRFLAEELKPAIDARFATLPGRDHTFLMGSSMGGMISMYGLCEMPAVFGGAACLSTAWIGTYERNAEIPDAVLAYLAQRAPDPATVRLWTDRGTLGLDAQYDDAHAAVTRLLASRGFAPPRFESRIFEGTGHDERDWARRADRVFEFLLTGAGG